MIDIDDENVQNAQKTVSTNTLESRIKIVKTDPSSDLIPLQKLEHERFVQYALPTLDTRGTDNGSLDFTMCNPPFYTSRDEMLASAEEKERPPFTVRPPSPYPIYISIFIKKKKRPAQAPKSK